MRRNGTELAGFNRELLSIMVDLSTLHHANLLLPDEIVGLIMLGDMAPKRKLPDVRDNLIAVQRSVCELLKGIGEINTRGALLQARMPESLRGL